jgi:hypothetical protein
MKPRALPLVNSARCALIDAADYDRLACHSWRLALTGYVTSDFRRDGRAYSQSLQRAVMDAPPGSFVCFRNGDPLDCQRAPNARHKLTQDKTLSTGSIIHYSERDGVYVPITCGMCLRKRPVKENSVYSNYTTRRKTPKGFCSHCRHKKYFDDEKTPAESTILVLVPKPFRFGIFILPKCAGILLLLKSQRRVRLKQ